VATPCRRRRSPNCSRCAPGQGYAEFAVSSFGIDGAIWEEDSLQGKWAEFLLASRATTIYGGTSEVQLNIIAERLLGLPRDP
jgi:alkylation response protein AidB-like acyl-CoA dehydrogenase